MKQLTFIKLVIAGLLILTLNCNNSDDEIDIRDNTVEDVDGNIYETVQIGDQVWIKSNLRVTKYRNGDPIPLLLSDQEWSEAEEGGYCIYELNDFDEEKHGYIYNWYAVHDNRGIAPSGFRVATENDWNKLSNYLASQGFQGLEGEVLKTDEEWIIETTENDNFSFMALPSGFRARNGSYNLYGSLVHWWARDTANDKRVRRSIFYNSRDLIQNTTMFKTKGYYVRCIKE